MAFLKLPLDLLRETIYNVSCNKEVRIIAEKSRADYFKERRKKTKAFNVEIEKGKMEEFEKILSEQKKTKKQWLDEKISEELKK